MAKVQSAQEINLPSKPLAVPQNKDLDLVALTMAALRFANPWTAAAAEPSVWPARPEPEDPQPRDRVITLAEVSQHDTPRDCWVVIYDRVYDISTFLDEVSSENILPFGYSTKVDIFSQPKCLEIFIGAYQKSYYLYVHLQDFNVLFIVVAPWWET